MTLKQFKDNWKQTRTDLLETIRKFSDAELSYAPFEGSWTVGQIILHIAQEEKGEIGYGLIQDLPEWPAEYRPEDYPTVESMVDLLTGVHDGTEAYLDTLDDEDLVLEVTTPWGADFELGSMVFHTLAHEIHHRAELSLILGMLGREGLDA
jgi:uncharacterized damage-inducible protein DinB